MKLKHTITAASRLYQCNVPLVGLTGGIATGKTQAGHILKKLGRPVIEADLLIKCIYQQRETLELTKKLFPEAIDEDKIDFSILRQQFFHQKNKSVELQNYLYKQLPHAFMQEVKKIQKPSYIFYDVPLLFENKLDSFFDTVVLIYAPLDLQKSRLIKRDGSSDQVINSILAAQLDIEEKKKRSPWVIENTQGLEELEEEIKKWLSLVEDV